ncbi:ATP synthase subunit e, mitochondrial-like [Gigantopelta aegis]|uniref:ATP synthase subunit e, mitochondrial-like n=1 Tax=Gigantopelta aegis TaxID=1735272 RepID=UPI001B88D237|nr:ATP synthase subunit e, mitochondrial-like [Gigantopelta aegis]
MTSLPAPKQISPLIRFGRYAALVTGIAYGYLSFKRLSAKEVKIQEHESKLRAVRDARLKEEKDKFTKMEMDALAKEMGMTPAPPT